MKARESKSKADAKKTTSQEKTKVSDTPSPVSMHRPGSMINNVSKTLQKRSQISKMDGQEARINRQTGSAPRPAGRLKLNFEEATEEQVKKNKK